MDYLFLDIDGVLNGHQFDPAAESCGLSPACVQAFNRILRQTDARVVLSSAWRYMIFREVMSPVGFGYMLRTHGVDKLISARLCGVTVADEQVVGRGRQIARWVEEANAGPFPVRRFAVLDDGPAGMSFDPVEARLVKTDGTVGLTESDADRVIALLTEPDA